MLRTISRPAESFDDCELANAQPASIPFPQQPDTGSNHALRALHASQARDTAAADNTAFGERLRHAVAVKVATQNGHDAGYRVGWRAGWGTGVAWGIVCGVLATLLCGGLVVMAINLIIGRTPGVFA